jgi:hypothetical protein
MKKQQEIVARGEHLIWPFRPALLAAGAGTTQHPSHRGKVGTFLQEPTNHTPVPGHRELKWALLGPFRAPAW